MTLTHARIISADSHVVEPPDVFEGRLPSHLKDKAPRLIALDGASYWHVDGFDPIPLPVTAATGSGWRRSARGPVMADGAIHWDDVLPGLYEPAERIKAQTADSIDGEFLYPTAGLWDAVKQLDDGELKLALVRAYNDWLAEFCAHRPDRLFGVAKLPATSVADARAELERAVGLGLRGAVLDAWPSGAPSAGRPDDDPFWETVNGLRIPISLHLGVGVNASTEPPTGVVPGMKPQMADALLPLVASGVVDRYPEVKVVFAHGDAGWALHWMEFFDINYVRQRHLGQYTLSDPDAVPSEFMRRHAWFTFHQDRTAVRNRHRFGAVHLMWASHFPYEDANWPDDRQQAMRVTEEVPAAERQALLADNISRLYRLPGFEDGFGTDEIRAFDQLVHF